MNPKHNIQSFRFIIRACIIAALLLGCTQPIRPTVTIPPVGETPTLTASSSASPSPTFTPSGSPTPTLTPTDTLTATPSASPTITDTPAPTWTPWLVNMDWSADKPMVIDPKNPAWDCIITYFELSPAPGHLGVWRKDNGGYLACSFTIR